ncbi:angiotensin-converting enzyme [Caerostris extrusa]|uniref:Angiotensin-converting enzyme n=1 Tax=Caerostris extrusa TaxID=172846 RepID=A0AAV4SMC1_CAEEX|nr:angiotensin-converting enzyme [Caerostris extrusa]
MKQCNHLWVSGSERLGQGQTNYGGCTLEQTLEYSLFHKEAWKNATSFAWKSFNDTLLRRWFKSLSVLGTAALPEDKLNEFNRLKAEMKNTYSTAKVCPYIPSKSGDKSQLQNPKDCKLSLEPDLQRILTKSRDYDELSHVWKAWRDSAGKPIREKYLRFVNLSNEAARLNGFPDTGDMWREAYESDTFEEDLEMLWGQLKPLYEHLHAYVRRKLIHVYGNDKIKDDGPIPAHLFGNMWAQSWVSLLDITQPFSGKPSVDVTPIMEAKNLTALEMFKISEEFFTSLGLKPMPEEFWKYSLIEKPQDREIICHASAWDFCNGKDYRIKQCTDITMEDLITVHHEMGHIQYFLQYARQPNVFREGANPGFHEAIGDVLALRFNTKTSTIHRTIRRKGDLNFLLRTALDKVSFLPSGYLIDLWRWDLFRGDIQPENMNTKWWDLRLKYQGICPPVKRFDTDFDPGAKYHVPGNVPYIRYFVSFVIQFQFHKVLCDAAGHTGPLYKCDIYRSKEAGQILRKLYFKLKNSSVMELGSSEHWSEAMKIMTGGATNRMDAGPILEYFKPLLEFLEQQNRNETLGWISDDSTICP